MALRKGKGRYVEIRMQIMEEAKEKSDAEIAGRRTDGRLEDRYKHRLTQVHTSQTRSKKFIVATCEEDHPFGKRSLFKHLAVQERKDQ